MADKDAGGTRKAKADFLTGGGEMADYIRSMDWSRTPLGSIETWPQSLMTTVSLCLASNFPINIIWGREHTQIYNDGYRIVCGDAHPRALGEDYSVTWASAWPVIGEPFARALAGDTSYLENQRMFLTRNGYFEETFFTFSTSPVRDESGNVCGLFHPVTETTKTMLAERRTRSLRDLNAQFATAQSWADAAARAASTLAAFDYDLPFLLVYDRGPDGGYRLAQRYGISEGSPAAPDVIPAGSDAPWPLAAVAERRAILELDDVRLRLAGSACGPYDETPEQAFVLPIRVSGTEAPPTIIIAGASSRLPMTDDYRGYYELLAAALTAAATAAHTREEERRRAEALAELDRAKTTFFSNVSHEFRTPLTLMLGPLDDLLAKSAALDEDSAGQVALAQRNGVRLLKLVNSLLDFSRIEAGRLQARFTPTDLAAETAELASNFRSATDRAGLGLVVEAAELGEPVYLDRDMWEKIVLNLLSNAFKFTFEGEIRLTLKRSDDGSAAELTVRDTGTGIPPAELPRLFERFYRVEGSQGRSFEGSGIGLALVQELVRLQGGDIRVASEPGRGSAFTVSLPFGRDHLPPAQILEHAGAEETGRGSAFLAEVLSWLPSTEAVAAATPQPAPVISGQVLVADDNTDMRLYVARLLRENGLDVTAVADGEQALAAARQSPPDLILTDVMMPKLDGFELLAAIRADPALREVSVILLSARAGEEARVEGLAAGADDYLTKPFAARELVARVASAIGLARGRRTAQEVLREARKMEALGRLTGGVAHDFNNLLMVISGGLDMLDRRSDPARRLRILDSMRLSVERGIGLTRQLLAFSRRQPLKPEPIELSSLLFRLSDLLDHMLSGDIAVETQVEAGLWPIHADPAALELALLNLSINARDALPRGGAIVIRAANLASPADDMVRIEVVDTGIGMAPEVAARAFEPFFTTKDIGSGSGLGLAQVYGFVQDSAGSVSIDSTPGRGTTISLLLPRSAQAPPAGPATEDDAVPAPESGQCVLLVEDDEDVAALAADMLDELGYRVTRVASAAAALGALANGRDIDIVFSDIMMPGGMNGVELACEIRRRRPDLPMLLTSGYAAQARAEADRAGMTILPKPYGLRQLSDALSKELVA